MKPLFFNTLKGLAVFALSAVLLLLLLSFIAIRFTEPSSLVPVFSNITLLLSAFLCGRFSVNDKCGRLISGLISGLAAMLIILAVSLTVSSLDGNSLVRMLLTVSAAIFGALSTGSNAKHNGSARKRKNIAKRYGR